MRNPDLERGQSLNTTGHLHDFTLPHACKDMGAAQAEQSRTCVEEAALKRALSFLP